MHKEQLHYTGADCERPSARKDLGHSRRNGKTTVLRNKIGEQKNTGLPVRSAKFCKSPSYAPGKPEA